MLLWNIFDFWKFFGSILRIFYNTIFIHFICLRFNESYYKTTISGNSSSNVCLGWLEICRQPLKYLWNFQLSIMWIYSRGGKMCKIIYLHVATKYLYYSATRLTVATNQSFVQVNKLTLV